MDDVKTNADEAGGELVFFGATDWAMIGRTDSKKPKAGAPPPQSKSDRAAIYPNLSGPHRIASLQNVAITHVAAGSGTLSYPSAFLYTSATTLFRIFHEANTRCVKKN